MLKLAKTLTRSFKQKPPDGCIKLMVGYKKCLERVRVALISEHIQNYVLDIQGCQCNLSVTVAVLPSGVGIK